MKIRHKRVREIPEAIRIQSKEKNIWDLERNGKHYVENSKILTQTSLTFHKERRETNLKRTAIQRNSVLEFYREGDRKPQIQEAWKMQVKGNPHFDISC